MTSIGRGPPTADCRERLLEGVQVGDQVFYLVVAEQVAESRHLRASEQDVFPHPIVIRRYSARECLLLEDTLQRRSRLCRRGVCLVTLRAALIVEPTSARLLLGLMQLGIRHRRLRL